MNGSNRVNKMAAQTKKNLVSDYVLKH